MKQRTLLVALFIGLALFITSIWSVQAVETLCTDCTCESCCEGKGYISGECRPSCLDGETEETFCNLFCDCPEKCCCIPPECEVDDDCDDDLWCNGQETCEDGQCVPGTPVDCSSYDLPEIGTCDNDPDLNPFTWDYAPGFTSECDEDLDVCTTCEHTFTHTCADNDLEDTVPLGGCNAECDEDEDCACPSDECSDSFLYDYPDYGDCLNDCSCNVCEESGEPCEPLTIDCSEQDTGTGYCKCDCDPYMSTNGENNVDCDDGIDNDCDGLTDLNDTDCVPTTTTTTTPTTTTTIRRGGGGRTFPITTTTTTTIPEVECGNGECEEGETCSNCSKDCGVCPITNITVVDLIIPENVTVDEPFVIQVVVKNVGDKEGFDDTTISIPMNWSTSIHGQRVTLKPNDTETLYFAITPNEDSGQIAAGTSKGYLLSGTIYPLKFEGPEPMPITGLLALLTSLSYLWVILIIVIILILIYFARIKPSRKKA